MSIGEGVKKEEDAHPVGRDTHNLFGTIWKTYWYYIIKLNMRIPYNTEIPLMDNIPIGTLVHDTRSSHTHTHPVTHTHVWMYECMYVHSIKSKRGKNQLQIIKTSIDSTNK